MTFTDEHEAQYRRAAGRPSERPSRLLNISHVPVKDMLKIIAVFLFLFSPCIWLVAWVAGLVTP